MRYFRAFCNYQQVVEISRGRFLQFERRRKFVNKIARISNSISDSAIISCIFRVQDSHIRRVRIPVLSSYAAILRNGKAEFCRKPIISALAHRLYIIKHGILAQLGLTELLRLKLTPERRICLCEIMRTDPNFRRSVARDKRSRASRVSRNEHDQDRIRIR